jgi:hypothetical protein
MQRLEVSGAVRPIYGPLGVKRLITLLSIYPLGNLHLSQTVDGIRLIQDTNIEHIP